MGDFIALRVASRGKKSPYLGIVLLIALLQAISELLMKSYCEKLYREI